MSNQVVQLTDKDNNNIYPVAGALKQGSVTTSTIDDGAVTGAKIDFTTLLNNPKFIQAGKVDDVTFQANNSGGGFNDVTFDVAFDNVPIVVVTGSLQTGYAGSVSVTAATTTKFTYLARTTQSAASTGNSIRWIAIDPTILGIKSSS